MHSVPVPNLPCPYSNHKLYGTRLRLTERRNRITAVSEASEVVFAPGDPEITWQIVVGTFAGVTPFVVAGIEFSKRIVAQKKCTECGGSGLVLIEKEYIRCPNCGGFLPWQSWQRFFSG
ncbi:hypothetical protein CTI12_AA215050 [Artemisia annua]|uniref:Viral late gene transcription factor 3 zinc ribbon domain-containing protein n=1 Tax=Artemisia annua TaxID=35608 RepID=A0A2U1NY63_ARTAN|nr:hypothetical protein CTI12_AA215050 [Artemisia annua]